MQLFGSHKYLNVAHVSKSLASADLDNDLFITIFLINQENFY